MYKFVWHRHDGDLVRVVGLGSAFRARQHRTLCGLEQATAAPAAVSASNPLLQHYVSPFHHQFVLFLLFLQLSVSPHHRVHVYDRSARSSRKWWKSRRRNGSCGEPPGSKRRPPRYAHTCAFAAPNRLTGPSLRFATMHSSLHYPRSWHDSDAMWCCRVFAAVHTKQP